MIPDTAEEKEYQIKMLRSLHAVHQSDAPAQLQRVQEAAVNNQNIFEALMEACKVCSLGQITSALFEVGGQYRRNM